MLVRSVVKHSGLLFLVRAVIVFIAVLTASVQASSTATKNPAAAVSDAAAATPVNTATRTGSTTTTATAATGISSSYVNKPDIGTTLIDLPMKVVLGVRRYINLNGLFLIVFGSIASL